MTPSAKKQAGSGAAPRLYLDQNYLSGIAKRTPAFRELERALRDAVGRGAVAVAESAVHERESRQRPDLKLLELLRELSGGRRLPTEPDPLSLEVRRRLAWTIEHELPERRARHSDAADLDALAIALRESDLVTCDRRGRAGARRMRAARRSAAAGPPATSAKPRRHGCPGSPEATDSPDG